MAKLCSSAAGASPVHVVPAGGAVFSRRLFLDASLAVVAGATMGPEVSAKETSPSRAVKRLAPASEALAFLSLEDASALLRTKKYRRLS